MLFTIEQFKEAMNKINENSKPTKERPFYFFIMGFTHLFKNDGENLYAQLIDDSWKVIDKNELMNNQIIRYIQ